MTQNNDRLDRIETILERLAQRQEQFQLQLERQNEDLDREFEFIGSSLGRLERQVAEVSTRVDTVAAKVDVVAARVDVLATRLDESVRQADLDRQMFVNAIERLIELLNQQFTSNGHGES